MTTAKAVAFTTYIASIVLANVMTARLGLVPVGFGLMVTAGTFAAGFALLARDFLHRAAGLKFVLAGIAIGAALSWALATPMLALASCVAFTVAEAADLFVFSRLRQRGFVRAAFLSNLAAAPIDTVLFLAIAGFPITWQIVAGQLVGKILWATAVPLAIYVGVGRAVHGEPVNVHGA